MATVGSVMAELEALGSEKTRATYARHGMPVGRTLGVSVADLKVVAKTIKKQQALALELYETGMMDAMYLAGMVADGALMTKEQLQRWAEGADGLQMIAEYTVPWVTVESLHGRDLALRWMDAASESVASSGWCTYSGLLATQPDGALEYAEIEGLLERVVGEIDGAANRVKMTMNGFVVHAGIYVEPLHAHALATAKKLGAVPVHVGDTACKVPLATEYIAKAEAMGRIGRKKKTIRY